MVLVDTSVWVDHLRGKRTRLPELLAEGTVLCHPFIVGELACGNIRNRDEIMELLQALPMATPAAHREVLHLLQGSRLFGRGLGWIDAHLLSSALLSGCSLWTRDKSLAKVAGEFNQSF
jgi:predicted nucleic acid-binding protein